MKWPTFKLLLLLSVLTALPALSQEAETSVAPEENRYDRRVHRYRKGWDALIPNLTKIQYAGNMGMISAGIGWDYGKHDRWETDVLVGFVPVHSSGRPKITLTVKQNFIPWSFQVHPHIALEPLTTGLYLNTIFGRGFWTQEPEKYPTGYYKFSNRIRFHVFAGQRINFTMKTTEFWSFARNMTLFYELSTYDLLLVSAITNSYLKPKDYLCLSFGVSFKLF